MISLLRGLRLAGISEECPLWVISGHQLRTPTMSALPPKADIISHRLECLLWVAISTGRCNTLFESVCRVGLICEIPSLDCYVIAA
jgi:hypothetical protein